MAHTNILWHQPWVRTTEAVVGHVVAVIAGFIMIVFGLGLSLTMIMLPVGLVIGLVGVATLVGGLFARIDPSTRAR
jgi:hypothetical protein